VYRFHRLWETKAAEHGALHLRGLLGEALERASSAAESAAVRARLEAWRQRWDGLAEAALRIVVQSVEQTSQAVVESLSALARPGRTYGERREISQSIRSIVDGGPRVTAAGNVYAGGHSGIICQCG
jgi:hypothetical protein